MAHPLRGSSAIVGVGRAGCGEAPGRSHLELIAEATHYALEEAGLRKSDIDGVWNANLVNFMPALTIPEYLGIRPKISDGTNLGGSSFLSHMLMAAAAIRTGLCEVALICYGSVQRSQGGKLQTSSDPPPYEVRYRPRQPPTAYALGAARHMYEFGTTREQLAAVAVAARQWALKNPEAFTHKDGPLTISDVLKSRMVCDPLTVRDCCLVTDGGAAIIMTSAERAKDLKQRPVYLLGGAAATWNRQVSQMPDLVNSAAQESGPRAFEMAGIRHADVDLLALYDAFTINVIMQLEDLGFVKKGEGGPFVASGAIGPGGSLPVNPNGGGLADVHPGMYGMFLTIEAVRQLRGGCGERQIAGAEIAVCHGNGGTWSSQVTNVLGTEATL
jgi:acetyl-CoA acetyltransferase